MTFSDIAGATGANYTLADADVGQQVRVVASYTDGGGTAESVASAASAAVANVNDAPTGAPSVSGTAAVGQVLTAGPARSPTPTGLARFPTSGSVRPTG
ncbi:MAG: hypothetical protein IIB62_10640 [Proteobacteria bacterium]|nr:hypothetical protein [Pseudomonadota bacterium]